MEIMQQSANHLDGRWRPHLLPYSGGGHNTLSSLPNLHDHIRQQMISQQQSQQQQQSPDHLQHNTTNEHLQQQQIHHHHHHHQQQPPPPLPQQMSHRQDQQLQQQQQHRQIIVQHQQRRDSVQQQQQQQPPPPSKEQQQPPPPLTNSRGGGGGNGLPSPPLQLNSLSLQSSPSSASPSTPPTPSPPAPSPGKSGGKDGEEKKGEEWEQYNAGAAFLGPTLWDKTLSYDSDLKVSLEYMDLDEFLNENGIPIEASKRNGNNATGGNGGGSNSVGLPNNNSSSSSSNSSSSSSSNSRNMRPSAQSPEAPSSPENSPPQMGTGMGACPQVSSSMANAPPVTASGPISVVPPPALSPQDYIGDCSSSVSSPGSPDPHSPLQGHEPVPGQDFDPRTRCFSEEELKPQPMIKKSRKQFVPPELKDEKYWARRRKNNMAAKRSRDARRLKENQIAMRANFLEKENNAMTVELQKAQAIVESLKKRLAMYEAV